MFQGGRPRERLPEPGQQGVPASKAVEAFKGCIHSTIVKAVSLEGNIRSMRCRDIARKSMVLPDSVFT